MRGQFIIIATLLICLLLVNSFLEIRTLPSFDLKEDYFIFLSGFHEIPSALKSRYLKLKLFNFKEKYFGPILIEVPYLIEFNSEKSAIISFGGRNLLILFSNIKEGENSFFEIESQKEVKYFFYNPSTQCVDTINYSLCNNSVKFFNGKLKFPFKLKDWGDIFLVSAHHLFLPNSIFVLSETIEFENLTFQKVEENVYRINYSDKEFYLVADEIVEIDNKTLSIKGGTIFFGDKAKAKMAKYQDFYLYSLEINDVTTDESLVENICADNSIRCLVEDNPKRVGKVFFFNCNESNFHNFITKFEGEKIGDGSKVCYSVYGVPGASEYSPKRLGAYSLEKEPIRIFDEEKYIGKCCDYKGEWYLNEFIRGIDSYVSLVNISGDFWIRINSTGPFWINTTDPIYMEYPNKSQINGSNLFYLKRAIFRINRTIGEVRIPSYSMLEGKIENISKFWAENPKISCFYCTVSAFDGPIRLFSEIISEKKYNLSATYTCSPKCTVESLEIFLDKNLTFCPPAPAFYSHSLYLIAKKPDTPYQIRESPFSILGIEILVNGSNTLENFFYGNKIARGEIDNLLFTLGGGKAELIGKGKYILNFSEEFNLVNEGEILFKDRFVMKFTGHILTNKSILVRMPPPVEFFFFESERPIVLEEKDIEVSGYGIVIR